MQTDLIAGIAGASLTARSANQSVERGLMMALLAPTATGARVVVDLLLAWL